MNQEAVQHVKEIAPAGLVGLATMGSGLTLGYLPSVLTVVATMVGIVLSVVLTMKAWVGYKHEKLKMEMEEDIRSDIEDRISKDLPCRRCKDREVMEDKDE